MESKTKTLLRMRDCALALQAAGVYDQALNRLRLQKFIYLMDVLSSVYNTLSIKEGHTTYHNGPYDCVIQNAVDSLVFRGFARAHAIRKENDGKIHAQYSLTESGRCWVSHFESNKWMDVKWTMAQQIAKNVNNYKWEKIKTLVYAEPTYVAARKNGFGEHLNPTDMMHSGAAQIFRLIDATLKAGTADSTPKGIPPGLIADLFFRYLAEYSSSVNKKPILSMAYDE